MVTSMVLLVRHVLSGDSQAQLGEALHVVRLLGAVTMTSQLESSQLLILEFCECGSLDLCVDARVPAIPMDTA